MHSKKEKLDSIITRKFLKPSKSKPNHFLYNTEKSMHIFEKDKKNIMKFCEKIRVEEDNIRKIEYYLKSSDIEVTYNEHSYKECLMLGKPYDETISYKISLIKRVYQKNNINEIEMKESVSWSYINEFKNPIFVGTAGCDANNINKYPNNPEVGGFFVGKDNLKKNLTLKEDKTCTRGKYKGKLNSHHFSFNSIPFDCIDWLKNPQYISIDMDLNLNKMSMMISSKKTLPSLNVLILICYLTGYELEKIKNFIMLKFNDKKLNDIINILIHMTKEELLFFSNEEKYNEKKLIEKYVIKYCIHFIKNEKKIKEEDYPDYFNKIIHEFLLPSVNSMKKLTSHIISTNTKQSSLMMKGMTLLLQVVDFLTASFQNQIYPKKHNSSIKKISPPGTTLKNIFIDEMKNIINNVIEQTEKSPKVNNKLDPSTIKTVNRTTHTINNMFNMNDPNNSSIVKPYKSLNFSQNYSINNLIVPELAVSLKKRVKKKDPDISQYNHTGPFDTPDHGPRVGMNRRLNTCTIIDTRDMKSQRELIISLYDFLSKYTIEGKAEIVDLNKDIVPVSIVDESEVWIGNIYQEDIITVRDELIKRKINNVFPTCFIGVALHPRYKETKLKLFFPEENVYTRMRINICDKTCFSPYYIVKDGKLLLESITDSEDVVEKMTFDDIIKKYNIIEFIDPEQFEYSNVCESLFEFDILSEKEKKMIQYVSLDTMLRLSIQESMSFDMGKAPGHRGIFSISQSKNSATSTKTDSPNSFEAGKFSIFGYQECCITNDILEESRISKQSNGNHTIVAYTAYNYNIEDAIIVNAKSVNNGLFLIINAHIIKGDVQYNDIQGKDNIQEKKHSYSKLDDEGIPKLNAVLEEGDALYGNAEAKIKKSNNQFYLQDNSTPWKFTMAGRVDRISCRSKDNYINLKCVIFTTHHLECGHKMANQCAQKSTISKVAKPDEIFYNSEGVSPDIIINSLSVHSRKTLNIYYQTYITQQYNYIPYGKDGKKEYINYKPYSNNNISTLQKFKDDLAKEYPEYSNKKINNIFNCETIVFDPLTGERLKQTVMMGPLLTYRSVQISDDKISSRNRGKLDVYNQPSGNKQKNDSRGQRLGEMEIDILATHGCARLLYEFSQDSIEAQRQTLVCKNCTNIATKIKRNDQDLYTCLNCENINITPNLEKSKTSKAAKINIGLLKFEGINVSIITNKIPILYPSKASK